METKHTPTPWYIAGDDEPVQGIPTIEIMHGHCPSPECESVAWVNSDLVGSTFKITKKTRANAELIVRCVNVHDELVACLEYIDSYLNSRGIVLHKNLENSAHINRVLKKARGDSNAQ